MFGLTISDLPKEKGYKRVLHVNSFIQVISWDEAGQLGSRGVLTFSQSQEPDFPHYANRTGLISDGERIRLPTLRRIDSVRPGPGRSGAD